MNTKEPFIITISREVGSGGHTVGSLLAKQLNVRYCDKQLLKVLEKEFHLTAGAIETLKAEKKNWMSDFVRFITPMPLAEALELNPNYALEYRPDVTTEDIFNAEKEILQGFAQEGSCVIAGRSGFYVFKDHPNVLNVFITASLPYRLERIMKKQNLSEEDAMSVIKGIDKARENYIQRFAGVSRYDVRNYHLSLCADGHTEEQLVQQILSYIG